MPSFNTSWGRTHFQKDKEDPPRSLSGDPFGSFKPKTVKFWDPDFSVDTHHIEEYFVWTLRQLLENAIDLQMRSDVPLARISAEGSIRAS